MEKYYDSGGWRGKAVERRIWLENRAEKREREQGKKKRAERRRIMGERGFARTSIFVRIPLILDK